MSLGVWATVSLGDWVTVSLGDWATVSLGDWATVSLGDWATASLGDWATVSLRDWAILTLGIEFDQKEKRWLNQRELITKKIDSHLKSSMDRPQWESNMKAIQMFEAKVDIKHAELRKDNVTKHHLAYLLPNRQDLPTRLEKLFEANNLLLKTKYQPEWTNNKSDRLSRHRDELTSFEGRCKNIGQMITMMRSLKYEKQLKEFLQLQNSREKCDEMIEKNEDEVEKNRDALCNSEDYKALLESNEETLEKRAEIVVEMNGMLKPRGDTSIYRELHRLEGILARAHVNWQEQQLKSRNTSPQKEPQRDDEQNEDNGHNADDSQERNKCARSLPIEELSIHSRSKRTKSNKTSVISKSSSARRVLNLELNALKEQEEMQSRLEKLRRNAEQNEIADLQEKLARKAKIVEKEIERTKVSSICGSSFRSISPVGTPDANLSKISERMDKTEEVENVASTINVPSVYQQTSVSAPVLTVRSIHGGQCAAQVSDLKPSVKPTTTTGAAIRDFGMDTTKTVIGTGSQSATAQQEVKFVSSKPSMTLSADQNRLPPTNGGNPSSAFQVPQLANTQKQYMTSQEPDITSNTRDDYFIISSLPKLRLAEFSGGPLKWPEWSQLFQATVHAANLDDSVKMNHLKTMVTGKAKEAIAGLGYTGEMYNVAWNVLVRNFGKPQMVVNAQLKRIYSFPPMKPYDGPH